MAIFCSIYLSETSFFLSLAFQFILHESQMWIYREYSLNTVPGLRALNIFVMSAAQKQTAYFTSPTIFRLPVSFPTDPSPPTLAKDDWLWYLVLYVCFSIYFPWIVSALSPSPLGAILIIFQIPSTEQCSVQQTEAILGTSSRTAVRTVTWTVTKLLKGLEEHKKGPSSAPIHWRLWFRNWGSCWHAEIKMLQELLPISYRHYSWGWRH